MAALGATLTAVVVLSWAMAIPARAANSSNVSRTASGGAVTSPELPMLRGTMAEATLNRTGNGTGLNLTSLVNGTANSITVSGAASGNLASPQRPVLRGTMAGAAPNGTGDVTRLNLAPLVNVQAAFSGPYINQAPTGLPTHSGYMYRTLSEAQAACLALLSCNAITMYSTTGYLLIAGVALRQVTGTSCTSWLKNQPMTTSAFSAPYGNQNLLGCTLRVCSKFDNLQSAQDACLADPECAGITMMYAGDFELSSATSLVYNSGGTAWLKRAAAAPVDPGAFCSHCPKDLQGGCWCKDNACGCGWCPPGGCPLR